MRCEKVFSPSCLSLSLFVVLGEPVWTARASDYDHDELSGGDSLRLPRVPETVTLDAGSELPEIGRWGEDLVHEYLLQQQSRDPSILRVHWANQEDETGLPYDFEVHRRRDNGETTVSYVEVKCTRSKSKQVFEISKPQVEFAQTQRENYDLYRVLGAGDPDNVKLIRISNLWQRLGRKQVRLCMVI
jgi:hypothetical protein